MSSFLEEEAEAEPESAELEEEPAVAMVSAVAEPIRVFIPDTPNVQQATRKVLKRRPTQQGARLMPPFQMDNLLRLCFNQIFSLTNLAARPHMDSALLLAPISLSPRLPQRDKAAAVASTEVPSGSGPQNLFLEHLAAALPSVFIRARTDEVFLVLQTDHRGRPTPVTAASIGDRAIRV